MQNRTHPLNQALGRLVTLTLLTSFLTLTPRVQAQSEGPLSAWKLDAVEEVYKEDPLHPDGDGILDRIETISRVITAKPSGIFKAVAAGPYHCVAIRSDGTLAAWGFDGNLIPEGFTSTDPYRVVLGTPTTGTFKAVAAGSYHSVAIRSNGSLFSWGNNANGQVSNTPTTGTYLAVAAGEFHSLALRSDGTLISWGLDEDKQVSGTPTTGTYIAIAARGSYSLALRSDGTLVAWGDTPDHVGSATPAGTFKAMAAGNNHVVALRTDGTLVSWGNDEDKAVTDTPKTGTFVAVAAGDSFSVAVRADGTLMAWGKDDRGQVSGRPNGVFQALTAAGSYSVGIQGYAWSGFLPPIQSDGSTVYKLGSTIPVKIQLTGLSAGLSNLVVTFSYKKLNNNTRPVNQSDSNSQPSTGNLFRYDPVKGNYIYNWGTKSVTTGTGTYEIKADLGDGLTHTVQVILGK